MMLDGYVQASANLQRETVGTAGGRSSAGKDAVKAVGFSRQGVPENGIATMRRRPAVPRTECGRYHVQAHPRVIGVPGVESGHVCLHTHAMPKFSNDLDAAPLHPEPVGAHRVGQKRVIQDCYLQARGSLGSRTVLLPPKAPPA